MALNANKLYTTEDKLHLPFIKGTPANPVKHFLPHVQYSLITMNTTIWNRTFLLSVKNQNMMNKG